MDLWGITRKTRSEPWGVPFNLGPTVNSPSIECDPSLSHDGRTLYFAADSSDDADDGDIWRAPILPIVDFNGDGKVDGADICTMVDHWGTDDSVCDIGPMAWGDGVVDVEDLKVLAGYIGEEVYDPTLIAHWAFDENEGPVAHDSVGDNDGTVTGNALWQPDGGMIGGALELDGTTCVVADVVVNPHEGAFSVFAWVKGDGPGQVMVSQQGGANWLMTDVSGSLMTELNSGARQASHLTSGAVITDGNWHRVGFAWDGSIRSLYVDDILVAEDTDVGLADAGGGLNIGCGKNMTPGTYFTGLIDDVRIYNRAVKP
jgi:hypothetical protein